MAKNDVTQAEVAAHVKELTALEQRLRDEVEAWEFAADRHDEIEYRQMAAFARNAAQGVATARWALSTMEGALNREVDGVALADH